MVMKEEWSVMGMVCHGLGGGVFLHLGFHCTYSLLKLSGGRSRFPAGHFSPSSVRLIELKIHSEEAIVKVMPQEVTFRHVKELPSG